MRRKESPAGSLRRGFGDHVVGAVLNVSGWWSFCRHLGHGGAGGAFVDDGLALDERGEQRLARQVIDHSGIAAAGLVDQRDRVVGEQRVGAAGEFEVVFVMRSSSLQT